MRQHSGRPALEESYNETRDRIERIRKNHALVGLVEGEELHVWDRLNRLANMTREELLEELDADFTLFDGQFLDESEYQPVKYHEISGIEKPTVESSYKRTRQRIERVRKNPEIVGLVEGEELHVWDRLNRLANMSREELLQTLDADYRLFAGRLSNDPPRKFTDIPDWGKPWVAH